MATRNKPPLPSPPKPKPKKLCLAKDCRREPVYNKAFCEKHAEMWAARVKPAGQTSLAGSTLLVYCKYCKEKVMEVDLSKDIPVLAHQPGSTVDRINRILENQHGENCYRKAVFGGVRVNHLRKLAKTK